MARLGKAVLISTLIGLMAQYHPAVSHAQMADSQIKKVTALAVKNNKAISADTVLSKIKTKIGDDFNQEVLNDDLKRLYATEHFTDVSIDVEDYDRGVKVTFLVEEKSVIQDIVFKGNTVFRAQKLKSTMKSKANDMLNLSLLAQDVAEIKSLYVKKGYPLVDVKYSLDVDKELNKATITITVDEKTRVKVSKITVAGNAYVSTREITKVLSTKPAWLFNPGTFKEEVLEEDLQKIKSIYDDKGFLDAEVTHKADYGANGTLLYITIEIKEGKQYFVGDIALKGNIILQENKVRSKIKIKTGKPFSDRALRADVAAVRQGYFNYGYMNAVVDVDRRLNPDTGNIDITYEVDARNIVYVGKIEVRGNTKTKDVVVRRELRIYPGEKFSGDKIKRSKERLYNLGLFEDVNFDTERTADPNTQDLTVEVKETKTGEFTFGGGFSSIDKLLGFVEVRQRNFDIMNFPYFTGAGQDLAIKAELGTVRQNYNLSWTEPWILGYPLSFGFDAYQTYHRKRTDIGWPYDERRTGGDVRFGKELTDYLKADLLYKLEEVKIGSVIENASADLRAEEGSNWISSATLQLTYDKRDNVFNPTRGYMLTGAIEDAGGILSGDKDFVKGTSSASVYYPFFEKIVVGVSGRAGISNAYSDTKEVPIYERFFAGGGDTIRGYRERKVSPRDPGSNEPVGGEAILLGSAELTFPIFEKVIKGAVFYDAGNVWRKAEDFMVGGNYRAGTGVGVRVKTPIGPFKLDYGYPLVRNYDDEKTGKFYFSISRGF